ncbi:MAG: type II toxin-antitoxin system Phd/YefM family antitoxin [Acidobacteria bacterium]|nr:type II toxin-antitoxin system Phd/YefM family antitoxin [Acidobacteriota bacterium]
MGLLIIVKIPAIIFAMSIDEYIPASTAKSQLLNILRRIEEQHTRVVITKNGIPKAVLLPYRDFEGLRETIDILADPAMVQGIRMGLDDVTAGRVVGVEEAFED